VVLNIFVILFVLGITFMHSIFGLFSGLINLVCAIAAMVVAFAFFGVLSAFATAQFLHPSYTLPVCFVLLFFLTHLILRLAADNLIRGNVRLPMYLDWGGAAFCGFVIAMITVGMTVLGFLMLPWGGRVMMYSRLERQAKLDGDSPQTQVARFKYNHVGWFLRPDEFTVGLFNVLSKGSLRAETTLATVYPDFPAWVFWSGNTVQNESVTAPFRDDRADGWGDKGISVVTWWEQKTPVETRYRSLLPKEEFREFEVPFFPRTYQADAGKRFIGVRIKLPRASADRDEGTPHHRFRCTMIRVVGEAGGEPKDYFAKILGGTDPEFDAPRGVDPDNNFAIPCTGDETALDAYFEVDDNFKPHFIEYRRYARVALPAEPAAAAPSDRLVAASTEQQGDQVQMVGAMRFIDAIITDGTGDKPALPLTINRTALAAQTGNEDFSPDGRLKSGRITGFVDELRGAGPGTIRDFAPPEGKRLFQLRCHAKKAYSLAGKVFDFAGSVLNTYQAKTDNGEVPLDGYYAIVKRNGKDFIELYIPNETEGPAFRHSFDFKSITNAELRADDTIIGMLFFVAPGCKVTAVVNQTGQGAQFKEGGYKMGG
jgi:hypothetical protein